MATAKRQLSLIVKQDSSRSTSSSGCGQTSRPVPFERVLRFSQLIRARIKRGPAKKDMVFVDAPSSSGLPEGEFSSVYDYGKPESRDANRSYSRLLNSLSQTAAFKRLSGIRFLGSLDYAFVYRSTRTKQRYNRAQHSRGVALLAAKYCHWRELDSKTALLCVAAAMLHDIGHGPFSHTLEPLFKKRFGIDHHSNTEAIILGEGVHSREVYDALKENGVVPEDVVAILSGQDTAFDCFFSSPINFDTVEGILRSRAYIAMPTTRLDPIRVIHAATVRKTSLHRDLVDSFWSVKDEMYSVFIRSPAGVLCDYIFLDTVGKISDLRPEDFYGTEEQIFAKTPLLREILDRGFSVEKILARLPASLEYEERHFFVDDSGDFFRGADRKRYRQTKRKRTLQLS